MQSKRNLITAALPYANGPIHIGHIAGCYLPADTYVRFLRMRGEDVRFICGSDEHGVPITIKARKEGISPQEVVDRYHEMMQQAFAGLGISFDVYSRTSSAEHHQTAADFFKNLYDKGVFTEVETEQYYDAEAGQFLADRYIVGTCPKCGHDHAYGDQCEKCGASLNPTDLINPVSTLSGNKPELRKTTNWFLPLDRYQDSLDKYIESHRKDWKTNVYGQCRSWLNQGLQPRAMTRDLNWGVPVPLKEAEGKVLYVWFDAPIGYISATKELEPDHWKEYWMGDNSRLVHFIGKDNIVFHCIIFPAMLMAHGDFALAENVPANEFLNLEGGKISTSRNWAIWLHEYLEEMPNRQDELRYVLTSIAPETSDSEFTWKDYQTRVNSELVSILGNFINRVLVLYQKFFDGKTDFAIGEFSNENHQKVVKKAYDELDQHLSQYKFKNGLMAAMEVARHGNRYLTETEPWKLFKEDVGATREILNDSLLLIGHLGYLLSPFLPHSSGRIFSLLNIQRDVENIRWSDSIHFPANHTFPKPELLFTKVEDEQINSQLEKLKQTEMKDAASPSPEKPIKDSVSFDEFGKMDFRVGQIQSAEKVKKADKLLHLKVNIGSREINVVSGIAEFYSPDEILGKKVMVLLNLEPRKLRGILSEGMIMMAENADGKLLFVEVGEEAEPGAEVR